MPRVNIVADLWHAPYAYHSSGNSTTGSSEPAVLSDLAFKWRWIERVRARKWQVHSCTLPPNCQVMAVQGILVRHGISFDLTRLLLEDIKQAQ